jgi:hypothetical protein
MNRIALMSLCFALSLAAACTGPRSRETEIPVFAFLDIPIATLYADVNKYHGAVFEDRFKFYHIYHDRETAKPGQQTIIGKTHFTARAIGQPSYVIRIRITPEQEEQLLAMGIRRQDVLKARVRYVGLSPAKSLAFELLEILE